MKQKSAQTIINNRSVPFNTDAEKYVIGCIFIDNQIMNSLIGKIVDTDFYEPMHVVTFRAMLNLFNDGVQIDVLSVIEELKRLNYENVEPMLQYLTSVIDEVPSISSVQLYIDLVEEKAIERKLLKSLDLISNDILDHKYDLNELLDRTEDIVSKVVKLRRSTEFVTLAKAANDVLSKIQSLKGTTNGLTGLDTGFDKLNKTTLGLQKGDLIILAARPSVGKSTYAINLAMQVAKMNKAHVAFFSLEMSIEQILMRIYSYNAQVPLEKIRSGSLNESELMLLELAKSDLERQNLYFDESSSSNIADIRSKCRQLKQQDKLDLLVIDYLQLITTANSKGNRQEEVSVISRQLKTLAQELQIPILALSQLSRTIEGREDKEPQLSDLRESGSIEQDADIVMFLFRRSDVEDQSEADQLNEKVKETFEEEKKNNSELLEVVLSIAKNRQGRLQKFDYNFYGGVCKFSEQPNFRKLVKKKKKQSGMRQLNKIN